MADGVLDVLEGDVGHAGQLWAGAPSVGELAAVDVGACGPVSVGLGGSASDSESRYDPAGADITAMS